MTAEDLVLDLIRCGWVNKSILELFPNGGDPVTKTLKTHAAAARREERERCAKMAHEWSLDIDHCVKALNVGANAKDWAVAFAYLADEIAAAIRALSDEEAT